ncbi:LacI family DNA-binding transcriptional regulator [Oceanobacillus sp. CFH 90083]|uniref:LacI family DNA-binding transcriptional regulator n=1 Tax=Oceanobacillus sp. CFH 90083 TaxID=2592336 RepID=UPI00128C2F16|nr:LacI family DNA-binding transcriptional regulator [Oceanobacillus sp. CFH 90083]
MVTIKDIAKATGCSPSTVSRVIANNSRISEETKQKVRAAMLELGYHPNLTARNLVAQSTKTIGVIMPSSADKSLQNPFFTEILRGIGSYFHKQQFSMLLSSGQTEQEKFEEIERMVLGKYVDGIILLYSRLKDPIVSFLKEKDFPFVIVGKPLEYQEEIVHVDNDNVKAGKDITEHLIENGHKRISFIGGAADLVVTIDRQKGYETALKEAGISPLEKHIIHTEFLKSGGREAVEQILELDVKPDAIVVSDDLISVGVISTFEEYGIHIPEDISLVSFNNIYFSEIIHPALTTVDIQIFQIGAESAKAIIQMCTNQMLDKKRIIIPHQIAYRNSVRLMD